MTREGGPSIEEELLFETERKVPFHDVSVLLENIARVESSSSIPSYLQEPSYFAFSEGEAMPGKGVNDVIILNEQTLELLSKHSEHFSTIPELTPFNMITKVLANSTTLENARRISETSIDGVISTHEIYLALTTDESVWKDKEFAGEFLDFFRANPKIVSGITEFRSEKITREHFDGVWPEEFFELLQSEGVSLADRMQLRSIIESDTGTLFSPDHRPRNNITTILSKDLQAFVSSHIDEISPEMISELSYLKVPDRNTVEALFASTVNSSELPSFLSDIGHDEPVVVLSNYKGYESCPVTESRLIKEHSPKDGRGNAGILHFPDGTDAVLAFKHTEVTLAVCVESTNDAFEEGISYLPVGETLEKVRAIGDQEYQHFRYGADESVSDVWAVNRRAYFKKGQWKKIKENVRLLSGDLDDEHGLYEPLPKFQSHKKS